MFSGKNQASQAPTAFGSMLQASTYGMVIPQIYGRTLSPLLAIWANNLREGGSGKKGKSGKKGVTTYCERIDFLLGKNPLLGALQMWNNGSKYPLNFEVYSVAVTAGGAAAVSIPDSHFYAVVGVTLTQPYSETFNDYGSQGTSTLSGDFEVPLWNQLFAGPDPTDSSDPRNWPYTYRWEPSYGATIYLDTLPTGSLPSGTLNIYYAQLSSTISYHTPVGKCQLSFESILGSGDEYDGYTSQQILYPWYAGLGSPDIDLGSSGTIPALKVETQGRWGIYPTGDADFVDIIEDVVKSGITQAALGGQYNFGAVEHGLGQYTYPGPIQKKFGRSTSGALPPQLYDLPNTPGNILVCVATGNAALSIASSAGDAWTPAVSGSPAYQLWTAAAVGGANTVTVTGSSAGGEVKIFEIGGAGKGVSGPLTATSLPTVANAVQQEPGSASATLTGGELGATFSHPFNGPNVISWSGFTVPPLPAGAVVVSLSFDADLSTNWAPAGGFGGTVSIADSPDAPYDGPTSASIPLGADWETAITGTVATAGYFDTAPIGTIDHHATITNPRIVVTYTLPGAGLAYQVSTLLNAAAAVSTVQPGFNGYEMAVPFYVGSSAPDDAQVAKWELLSPRNLYGNAAATFQAYGRPVRNPGSTPFAVPSVTPSAVVLISVKATTPPTNPAAPGNFVDRASVELVRAQCRANGLWGSLCMTSQQAASDWITQLMEAANCVAVQSGFRLKFLPRSEVSAVGNGAVYNAPTAAGPLFDLDADNGDFVAQPGESPIKATRKARTDTDTVLQMQHLNRDSDYQQVVTAEPDPAGIALYGVRKKDPSTNNAVQDPAIARSILRIKVRRANYVEPLAYAFTLNQRWAFLEEWDLVTITDRQQGIVQVPVRITSREESDKLELACEAEPFIYGAHAPQALPATTTNPYSGGSTTSQSAGNVNPPIIFEPVKRLYNYAAQPELWLVVSSPSANYGGAQVYVSTDLGASYNPLSDPVTGNAITGELAADWPAAADPDTTNDLAVDLTESNGELSSYAVIDEDNFVYPCYVAGQRLIWQNNGLVVALENNRTVENNGTVVASSDTFGYELMTYATAVLTAANKYTLKAAGTGNHLRRAVFNAPDVGNGIDHPLAARFAFLSPAGTGILKVPMDALWVGQTLYFKLLSFNSFGAALQSLADVPAYAYTPTGVSSTV